MCGDSDCENVFHRLYMQTVAQTCPSVSYPIVYNALVGPFVEACHLTDVSQFGAFNYMPGPLPPVPDNESISGSIDELALNHSGSTHVRILLIIAACAVAVAIVIVYARCLRYKKQQGTLHAQYCSGEMFFDETNESDNILASCQEIPQAELTELRLLGSGGRGVVFLVQHTPTRSHNSHVFLRRNVSTRPRIACTMWCLCGRDQPGCVLVPPTNCVAFVGITGMHKFEV